MNFEEFKRAVIDLCEVVKEDRPVHFTGYIDGYSARISDDDGNRYYLVYLADTGKWEFRRFRKEAFE